MISQKCPVCYSSRIRRGYRPTRFWSKLFFRFNLLCDNCNWEFVGFAFPGFASSKQTKSSRDRKENNKLVNSGTSQATVDSGNTNKVSDIGGGKQKIRKKIKIRV